MGEAIQKKDGEQESDFPKTVFSASFTFLGLLVGFYSVVSAAIADVGPWNDLKVEFLPFYYLLSLAIVVNCILGTISLLQIGGFLQAKLFLTILTVLLFVIIAGFIIGRLFYV